MTSSNCCSIYGAYIIYIIVFAIYSYICIYIFLFSVKSSTDFNRRASTNCNLQLFYCCFYCLQCTRRFDLEYCYTVIQRPHCATVYVRLELLCTERVQRPIANDLTARTEAATLFLLLLLLWQRCLRWLRCDMCCARFKMAAIGGWVRQTASAVPPSWLRCLWQWGSPWLRKRRLAAFPCIFCARRRRCDVDQPKQRTAIAHSLAQQPTSSHAQIVVVLFSSFIVKLNFRHGKVQAATVTAKLTSTWLLISPHGRDGYGDGNEATLFYYREWERESERVCVRAGGS